MEFRFGRDADIEGHDQLLRRCETSASNSHACPHIHLFDDDTPKITAQVSIPGGLPKEWGSGVYSLAIRKPPWRQHNDRVCIEMLYVDDDLRREKDGRRLFLRCEFDDATGQHLDNEAKLTCRDKEGDQSLIAKKVVHLETKASLALSKMEFAKAILDQHTKFASVDFSGFEATLEAVYGILMKWRTSNHERL